MVPDWAIGAFMVLMTQIVGSAVNVEDRAELFDRCLRAAEVFWQVDNLDVFMPIFDSPEAIELRGVLQSICLNVFNGTGYDISGDLDDLGNRQSKLIVFHASDWRTPAARVASELVREVFPQATICVVTGLLPLPVCTFSPTKPVFDDARTLFQTAGIGFFSI
jgi:hypothetical protein